MPDCNYYNTLISASLDGELTSEEERELRQHLDSCRECRSYLQLMKSVSGALGESLEEPPEKLSRGILYRVELEASRKRFRFREWRWTAMAAVICLALFGVVKLGGGVLGRAENAADTAVSVTGGTSAAVNYKYSAGTGGGFGGGEAEPESVAVRGDTVTEYPAADMEFFADAADGSTVPAAPVEEEEAGAGGSLMAPADLPGYDVYYSLGEEAHYYSVLILYGELPEGVKPDRNWTALDAPAGQRRWELSLDAVLELELQAVFAEIYYDDLMADTGLVILLEEEK